MAVDPDLFLVLGLVLMLVSVPSVIGAISDRRTPRAAAVVLIAGGILVVLAVQAKPSGYTFSDVPDAFVRVVGRFF